MAYTLQLQKENGNKYCVKWHLYYFYENTVDCIVFIVV